MTKTENVAEHTKVLNDGGRSKAEELARSGWSMKQFADSVRDQVNHHVQIKREKEFPEQLRTPYWQESSKRFGSERFCNTKESGLILMPST